MSRGVSRGSSFTSDADGRWDRGAVERSGSFTRERDASVSIVFNAAWVRLTTPIGEGAFSRVFEGVYTNPETLDESVVAVKILKRNMLKRRSDCLRFIKEAKIMTRIKHRNIVACYGIGKYDDDDTQNPGSLFIIQELVRGGNLLHKVYKQMLNRHKCIYTSQEALYWMMDVALGMQYLHVTDSTKPMIIHRDLKLENIMLANEQGHTVAKLVDFGLHKVIDDRVKKVVKRVLSEANMGGLRLGRNNLAYPDEDDELEVALAQQRAAQQASGGGAAVPPVAVDLGSGSSIPSPVSPLSPASAAGGVLPVKTSRFSPLRSTSRAQLLEPPVEEAEEQEGEGDEEQQQQQQALATRRLPAKSPLSRNGTDLPQEDASPAPLEAQPQADPVAKVRSAPKRQSSMQKLVVKLKELKMRMTGKAGEVESPAAAPANNHNQQHSGGSSGATSPPESSTAAAVAEQPAVQQVQVQPAASSAQESRIAANHALLDKLIAQQSTSHASQVLDDFGLDSGTQQKQQRRAPRRAVTWVNEVRYNLTEAVGSWAYMAPEVVLGQPYNEKVDVFSFGVILFEVLSRKLMLVDEIKTDPRKDAQAYAERVARGFRPEIPRRWPQQLQDLIQSCWAQDPHMRPNFTAVVDILEELHNSGLISKLDVAYWSRGNAFI